MVEQDENGNYPIEASGRGDNTECVMCDAFNASRHYAVCLRTIGNHENDTRRANDSTCHRAMELSICPAQGMLADERDAGVALYYSPRTPHPAGQTEIDKQFKASEAAYKKSSPLDVTNESYQRAFVRTGRIISGSPPRPKSIQELESKAGAKSSSVKKRAARKAKKVSPVSTNHHQNLVNVLMEEASQSKDSNEQ